MRKLFIILNLSVAANGSYDSHEKNEASRARFELNLQEYDTTKIFPYGTTKSANFSILSIYAFIHQQTIGAIMKELASVVSVAYLVYVAVSFSHVNAMQTEMYECADAIIETGNFELRSQMRPQDFAEKQKLESDSAMKCKKMETHAKAIESIVK